MKIFPHSLHGYVLGLAGSEPGDDAPSTVKLRSPFSVIFESCERDFCVRDVDDAEVVMPLGDLRYSVKEHF